MRILLLLCFLIKTLPASGAGTIHAENSKGKKIRIALDEKKLLKVDGLAKSSAAIKAFRDHGDLAKYCFQGSMKEAGEVLSALVTAAYADGESAVKLRTISKNQKGSFVALVELTDKAGKREEQYEIESCR